MVRETTSTRRPPGSSSSGSSRPPRAPQDAVEEEQYYDQDNAGVTFLKIDILANFLLSNNLLCYFLYCESERKGAGVDLIFPTIFEPIPFMIGELNLFVFGDSNV